MNYSQKYCLVVFFQRLDIDTEFNMTEWPLHITVADVFDIDITKLLRDELTRIVDKALPLIVTAGDRTVLGNTKVVLINKSDAIVQIHYLLIDCLIKYGAVFNTPKFNKDGFIPHSTIQKTTRLNFGDNVTLNIISLVDMFPNANHERRKILYNFNGSSHSNK